MKNWRQSLEWDLDLQHGKPGFSVSVYTHHANTGCTLPIFILVRTSVFFQFLCSYSHVFLAKSSEFVALLQASYLACVVCSCPIMRNSILSKEALVAFFCIQIVSAQWTLRKKPIFLKCENLLLTIAAFIKIISGSVNRHTQNYLPTDLICSLLKLLGKCMWASYIPRMGSS